jgi:hypothetical protein
MHGLSLVNRDSRTTSASLPEPGLPAEFRSTLHSPSASPSRTGPIFQSDLSLARNENSLPSPHSRVSAPGLLVRYPPDLYRMCSSPMLRNAPPASAPLQGLLCPSGSKRSASLAFQKSTFTKHPISLRSPWPDSILLMTAADQRSRFAMSCQVRCFSVNLLEQIPRDPLPATLTHRRHARPEPCQSG